MKSDFKKRSGAKRGSKFGSKDRKWDRKDRPDMHKATCGKCHTSCEVPFKPTGSKVVLCSDCFGQEKKHESPGAFGRGSDKKPSYNKQESFRPPQTNNDEVVKQLKSLNEKMDILLEALLTVDEDFEDEEELYEVEVEKVIESKEKKKNKKSTKTKKDEVKNITFSDEQ